MKWFTLLIASFTLLTLSGCQLAEWPGSSQDLDSKQKPGSAGSDIQPDYFEFRFSTNPDRSNSSVLHKATLSENGQYYLFLESSNGSVGTVQFARGDQSLNSDNSYPYDVEGGSRDTAVALDMSTLTLGTHSFTAKLKGVMVASAQITVEPKVVSEPTPEPVFSYELAYSISNDRSNPVSVDGGSFTTEGTYYFFLSTDNTNATDVTFDINGTTVRTDSSYPFDLKDGLESTAVAQDMSSFNEGDNIISAFVNGVRVASASLLVESSTSVTEQESTLDVTLYWSAPMERENGDSLSIDEIGGYEIQYRLVGSNDYSTIVLNDGTAEQYLFSELASGDYEFRIAAFDTNGAYSSFVTAQ